MILVGFILGLIVGTYLFSNKYVVKLRSPFQNPFVINERVIEIKYSEPVLEATEEAEIEETSEIDIMYDGKVSYYSHEGCLGCNENQIMGNGQPFDENDLTLAIPCEDIISGKYEYGTKVRVVNQDNFNSADAVITDCGGFSKYDRVADLSLGLAQKLEVTTDQSRVVIYE